MKQLSFRIHPLLAAVIGAGAIFAVLFTVYGINRWVSSDQVIGNVTVGEAELGGRTVDEAYNAVTALEIGRLTRQAGFTVDGTKVGLEPGATGLDIDEDAIVSQAMAVGREGNFANQFLHWLTHIFATTAIPLDGTIDDAALEEIFDDWDANVIDKPIDLGSISVEEGEALVAHYPQEGVAIDRGPSGQIVFDSLMAPEAVNQALPTVTVVPVLTDADVDAALTEARLMLSGPVVMRSNGLETTFSISQLYEAFTSESIDSPDPRIVNSFSPEVIDTYLEPVRSQFEAEPVDARLEINGESVIVVPGANGTRIDETETAARIFDASLSASRSGLLPIVEGAEPDTTTEYLENLNVKHLVAQFTTYHDCCEPRNINIDLMADTIDGKIVLPGEIFSINDYVGERTIEKGYVDAPSIVAGEIVDTIGGGTSQFATTFYNAVYWGGYQDIDHKPHSYYFSRYPEGVEATLFWRSIDVKFRNNRNHAILIDTTHTSNSITVRFFGFNDGRTLSGEQRGGSTRVTVVHEGGPDALHVKGSTSDRYNITPPPEPRYRANPDLAVDQQKVTQQPRDGWSVTVTRTILIGGTEPFEKREWVVRYSPTFEVIEVHPCMMPGTSTACPTTTTTTIPTTTTSGGGSTTSSTAP